MSEKSKVLMLSGRHHHSYEISLSGAKKIVAEGRRKNIRKIRRKKAFKSFRREIVTKVKTLFHST